MLKDSDDMKAERLTHGEKDGFIAYCLAHRCEVDDSYLYDKDFTSFEPDEENPTYIVKQDEKIIAAASLIIDDYHRRGKNGRFRIFHSEKQDAYALLFAEIMKHTQQLDKVFLFVPFVNSELAENMEKLRFTIDRYVFLLIYEIKELPQARLPNGYSIRAFQPDRDEEDWCHIRNTAFSQLKGNSTPITPDMVRQLLLQPDYLDGGLMFLLHNNKPVGIIRASHDTYDGAPSMNIGPIAILPAHQGKGLGKQLLRTALQFAGKRNYKKTVLCVNAENERAKELYLKEGFVQAEGVTAYAYHLNKQSQNS